MKLTKKKKIILAAAIAVAVAAGVKLALGSREPAGQHRPF